MLLWDHPIFCRFLATLVALHFTPVSKWVSKWAEFRTSVASRLASLFWHSIQVIVQNWLRGVLRGAAYSLLLNLKLIAFINTRYKSERKTLALYEVSTNCLLNAKRLKTQWIAALHFQVLVFLPKIDIEIQISRDSDLNIELFKFESQNYIVKNLAALHRQVSKCIRAGVVLHLRSPCASPKTESKLRGVGCRHTQTIVQQSHLHLKLSLIPVSSWLKYKKIKNTQI